MSDTNGDVNMERDDYGLLVSLEEFLEELLDVLCEMPEDEIRQVFKFNDIPQSVDFSRTIGGTEYEVVSHFDKNARESLSQKFERLLKRDAAA